MHQRKLVEPRERALKRIAIVFISALFVISCSSNTEEDKIDTQFLDLSSAEHSEVVANYWIVAKRVNPQYPVSAARDGVSGCVDLIVGIGSDGRAEGYKVRSSYPKGIFDDYAAAALSQWEWKASEENIERTPVVTSIQLDFTTEVAPDDSGYIENCQPKKQAK